jgi:hypothetical protein
MTALVTILTSDTLKVPDTLNSQHIDTVSESELLTEIKFSSSITENAIKSSLLLHRIPYDLELIDRNTQHLRIKPDGSTHIFYTKSDGFDTVELDDVIREYKKGNIVSFLEQKKRETSPISWENQAAIQAIRDDAVIELKSLAATDVDLLVDEMFDSSLADIAHATSADINNRGFEYQTLYLLDKGYIGNRTKYQLPTPFTLSEA